MKALLISIALFLILLPLAGMAETKEIPFTMDDRDRIVRTEHQVVSLATLMNARFELSDSRINNIEKQVSDLRHEMNASFEQLFNYLWAIIGIFTAMFVSILGFAFWDRKISMDPIKRENRLILGVIREYADSQPRLREILKNAGLL